MYKLTSKIKNLRSKICDKQKEVLEKMYSEDIPQDSIKIKSKIDEINLLEEILDIRISEYHEYKESFWGDISKNM
tara:strand:- start:96 stop:320 length:225 start_codon:yes stop_codon:yes gene_type:complete